MSGVQSWKNDQRKRKIIFMAKKQPSSSLPHLDDFLLCLQTNNYSEETLYNYERDILVFQRFLFATYLAESGANPAAIQILLGHESLDTTTRYVQTSDRYAEKTHRDFHPLKHAE